MRTNNDREDDQAKQRDTSAENLADELSDELVGRFYAGAKGGQADDWIARLDHKQAPRTREPSGGIVPNDLSVILKKMFDPNETPAHVPRFTPELVAKRGRIRAMADELLGSKAAARQWFATQFKIALNGKAPIDMMETLEGCAKVEAFLCSLYPAADQIGTSQVEPLNR